MHSIVYLLIDSLENFSGSRRAYGVSLRSLDNTRTSACIQCAIRLPELLNILW